MIRYPTWSDVSSLDEPEVSNLNEPEVSSLDNLEYQRNYLKLVICSKTNEKKNGNKRI